MDVSPPAETISSELADISTDESNTGIRWKYVREGCTLMSRILQEAKAVLHGTEFTRRLYIDAVGYLLRGLPPLLSDEEKDRIWQAIPDAVKAFTGRAGEGQEGGGLAAEDSHRRQGSTSSTLSTASTKVARERTVVQQSVALLVLQVFFFLGWMLQYVALLLHLGRVYDDRFHVRERIRAQSTVSVERMARNTVRAVKVASQLRDCKVGKALRTTSKWWIGQVSHGVWEGLCDGIAHLESLAGKRGEMDDGDVGNASGFVKSE